MITQYLVTDYTDDFVYNNIRGLANNVIHDSTEAWFDIDIPWERISEVIPKYYIYDCISLSII